MRFSSWIQQHLSLSAIVLLMLLAFVVYTPVILQQDFIRGDGGMFMLMTEELRANDYQFPTYTGYNKDQIPFAYPPLGFIIAGWVADFTHYPIEVVFTLLPLLYTVLTVGAYFLFVHELTGSRLQTVLAVSAFIAMPLSLEFRLSGGGTIRALGFLFMMLILYFSLRMFKTGQRRYIPVIAILAGLITLTHLLLTVTAISGVLLLFLFFGLNKRGFVNSLLTAVGVLVIAAPWYLHLIQTFGVEILTNVYGQEAAFPIWPLFKTLFWNWIEEPILAIFTVTSFLGMFYCIAQRRWLPVIWVLLLVSTGHERGYSYIELPMQILFAIYAAEVILPSIIKVTAQANKRLSRHQIAATILLYICFLLNIIVSGQYNVGRVHQLTAHERAAMIWMRENTPEDSQAMVISHYPTVVGEWYPAISGRSSINTNQGYEWNDQWQPRFFLTRWLVECDDMGCVEGAYINSGLNVYSYEYLWMTDGNPACSCAGMRYELEQRPDYALVYANEEVSIFRHVPSLVEHP